MIHSSIHVPCLQSQTLSLFTLSLRLLHQSFQYRHIRTLSNVRSHNRNGSRVYQRKVTDRRLRSKGMEQQNRSLLPRVGLLLKFSPRSREELSLDCDDPRVCDVDPIDCLDDVDVRNELRHKIRNLSSVQTMRDSEGNEVEQQLSPIQSNLEYQKQHKHHVKISLQNKLPLIMKRISKRKHLQRPFSHVDFHDTSEAVECSELRSRFQTKMPLDFLDEPAIITPEIEEISHCEPSVLISLVENASSTNVQSLLLWAPAAERLTQIAQDLSPGDVLRVLKAFESSGMVDRALWGACTLPLLRHMSKLRPLQIIQVLNFYERAAVRPEKLYVSAMNALTQIADSMYMDEYSTVIKTLAQLKLANGKLLSTLARSITKNFNMITFNQGCLIGSAFRSLGVQSEPFYTLLDDRLKLEVQMMTIQELIDTIQDLHHLEFSWKPHEDLAHRELQTRLKAFDSSRNICELEDPFKTFDFLRHHGLLCVPFLISLCQWCEVTATLPPTRSTKKPLNHQLVILSDVMKEFGLGENQHLQRAIKRFVLFETTGRTTENCPGPVRYKSRRGYFLVDDPFKSMNVGIAPIPTPQEQLQQLRTASRSCQTIVAPPGLTVPSLICLDKLKQLPHIGALWSASTTQPRRPSLVNRTIRWTGKPPRRHEDTLTPVPGYDQPATKPIKYPSGWL